MPTWWTTCATARTGCSTWRPRSAPSSSWTRPWKACAPTSTARRTSSRWSYSEAKAIDESMVSAYVAERGLWAVIARLFNTVGPRQTGRYGMVIPRFVRQGLSGEPLTVFGTGDQVRCFCHVHDAIPALIALTETEAARGRAVNLGSSEQVSITGLAERVIAATGSRSGITRSSYLEAYGDGYEDMQRRVPDCTLARGLVGFEPARTLDDIIGAVIEDQLTAATINM